ncbi:acylphosphatase [Mariluticola halotolerans]|uniref:acylphosphatase n=1 Tax=Mariluticola halotolerans TaxID=2909283 RepID=UPI0026E20650|nr:acylphosphatase [Mariluticola halotolerans]UJQ93912.1 acylphosphatase [Mariluticola halotolerans]
MSQIHVRITGRVQGVGFRLWVAEQAGAFGLSGWVCNKSDGAVEAVFAGDQAAVSEMLNRLWQGPSGARVTDVAPEPYEDEVLQGFEVRDDG